MTQTNDPSIPFSKLAFQAGGSAALASGAADALNRETLAALLSHVVERAARDAAQTGVEPISATIDYPGAPGSTEGVDFSASIDRKTRSIIFARGEAVQAGKLVQTASIAYRILAG